MNRHLARHSLAWALSSFVVVGTVAISCGNSSVSQRPTSSQGGSGGGAAGSDVSGLGGTIGISGGLLNNDASTGVHGQVAKLEFDPPEVTIVIDSATANKVATYTLKATLPNQMVETVAAEAVELDRPDLASIAAGPPVVLTASGTVAGTGVLHGVYGGLEATAKLIVKIVESEAVGTVPQTARDALGKDGLAQDPVLTSLLYPYDQTVFPLGLNSPTMMWNAPNPTGDVYRIRLAEQGYTYDLYTAADAPSRVKVPQAAWDRVTASNTGDKLVATVSRWDSKTGTAYTSAAESFTIAPESLRGAIYYWAATSNGRVGSIMQIYPGSGAAPKQLNQGKCMGCHSVSADGTTLVASVEDPSAPSKAPYGNWTGVRAWAAFSLPAATQVIQTDKSGADTALSPDGKYVVFGGRTNPLTPGSKYISLATTATGVVFPASGLDDVVPEGNMGLMMPSFSIDGTKLALVEGGIKDPMDNVLPEPSNRVIYLDFDSSVPKFSPTIHEVVRVSAFPANNNQVGYPAFTPDSQYVAYHTGQYSTGCHPGDCVDATMDGGDLWISAASGGAPIRLDKIDDPPAAKDHFAHREPTFCPVKRGGYAWAVFTSMRDWGNMITGPVTNAKRRIWVAAIDEKIGTTDPSHPAFYVEAQLNGPNMRGFWALAACIETPKPGMMGPMCTAGFECCSGFCVNGQCADKAKLSCVGVNQACKSAGECCNQGATDCIDGVCKVGDVK
jgi:hypothetical protein